jgi:hypothetical protein
METGATSVRLDRDDRQVQAEQIRRARSCQALMSESEMLAMKEDLRAQRRANRPAPTSPPSVITSCDPAGCFDSQGNRYNRTGTGNFTRRDGATCLRVGSELRCQ